MASASLTFSNGTTTVTIIKGESVTYSWSVSGGYSSATLNGSALTASGSAVTYSVQNIPRWFSTSPAPGDHICSPTNPGGYTLEGTLFKSFTTQAPGTFLGYDAEVAGVKPFAYIGYVYPYNSTNHPVSTLRIYEKIDPAGGPPNGFGTIWTTNSGGEGPYTGNGPNNGFKAPTSGYTDYSGLSWSGTETKSPTVTTSYSIVASGGGQTSTTKTITVTVLIPPTINFTVDNNPIKVGNSTTLRWTTAGDADTLTWVAGNLANTLLTSEAIVSPTVTTVYTVQASGDGGTSPKYTITLVVNAPPEGEFEVPVTVDYAVESFDVSWSTKYANTKQRFRITVIDLDGNNTIEEVDLTPLATSAETAAADTDTERSGTYTYTPTWTNRGPSVIRFALELEGDGGSETVVTDGVAYQDVLVNIDQTPDNFLIPDRVGVIKSEEPVLSPDGEISLEDLLLINDIDIPIEIKSSNPIQVKINNSGQWQDIRSYGAPAVPQGMSLEEDEELVEIEGPFEAVQFVQEEELTEQSSDFQVVEADPESVKRLVTYATSLNVPGYSAYDHPAWSGFMNDYATHPFDTNANANNLGTASGSYQFTASYSGTYTITAAVDNAGTVCLNGTCTNAGGFTGNGNSTSRNYNQGNTVTVSWSFYNTNGNENFDKNPAGLSWRVTGPSQPAAPGASLSSSGSGIIAGNCVTLTWSSSGNRNNAGSNFNSNPGYSGSQQVCPTSTTNYTYTVCGEGGCTTAEAQVVVYTPPTVNFTANKYFIKNGENVTLYWVTSGDASTLTWVAGNIANTLLTSQTTVSPQTTTTYTLRVSGLGGTSPNYSVTIVVYEPPEGSFSVPAVIDYGTASFDVAWQAKYANTKVRLRITTIDLDGVNTVTNVDLPLASSAQAGGGSANDTSGTYTHTPSWGNRGPSIIRFALELSGDGGSETIPSQDVLVNIDETPDNILIPDTIGAIKSEEPVISPEGEVLSDLLYVDDIDIPVEIKATNPILVSINNDQNTWQKLRATGAPAIPVGNSIEEEEEIIEEVQESVSSESVSEELQVVEADPTIVKSSDHTDVDYTNLITCISIIDESSPSVSTHQNDWTAFRNNYPNRTFYLLQATFRQDPPQGDPVYGLDRLNRPSNFLNDPYAYTVQVNRDDQTSNISNWFNICGLQNVPAGSYVSVWLDISGSMTATDVQRSYNAFANACSNAGIVIVLETSDSGERWIPGHNKDLPPSGFITADKTTVKDGEQFELTWVAFGEVTQVTISNYNNGSPVTFTGHDDLTITQTTTFTMAISGTTGATEFRSVTVTLIPKPVFNIWLLSDPTIQEAVRKPSLNTQLNWSTTPTGSGETLTWTSGNLGNNLLTSQVTVNPADTTTYCGFVTGPGGTSDTKCATIKVSQLVTLSADSPGTVDYGTAIVTTSYTTKYSDIGMKLEVFFNYLDGSTSNPAAFTDDTLLHPTSFELNPTAPAFNEVSNEEVDFDMSSYWNTLGPSSITFRYTADGTAGTEIVNVITLVNIDQTPDNILIPDSLDLLKDQEPILSPEEGPIDSMLLINDIDVPVEILSDHPIKVQKNLDGTWSDIRNLNP